MTHGQPRDWLRSSEIAIGRRLTLLLVILIGQTQGLAVAGPSCATDNRVIAPCFTVHGRLSAWNGTPTYRIWVVGTKRILGVSEGQFAPNEYELLPPEIAQRTGFDTEYFGDFTVCPFEPVKPKTMRLVCVASVANLQITERK